MSNNISTLSVTHAASLWYPIMLAQEAEEISESKAAELLALNVVEYRVRKNAAIAAVVRLVESLPSPLTSLVDILTAQQQLSTSKEGLSNSSGKGGEGESS